MHDKIMIRSRCEWSELCIMNTFGVYYIILVDNYIYLLIIIIIKN